MGRIIICEIINNECQGEIGLDGLVNASMVGYCGLMVNFGCFSQ